MMTACENKQAEFPMAMSGAFCSLFFISVLTLYLVMISQ